MTLDSLAVALIYLSFPWLLVEAASQVLLRLSSRQGSAVLSIRNRLTARSNKETKNTWVSRGPLWFRVETTSLNELPGHLLRQVNRLWGHAAELKMRPSRSNGHDDWVEGSKSRLCQQAQTLLELVYDAGTLFAGLALISSIIFLIWGAFDLISQISQLGNSGSNQSHILQRRGVEEAVSGGSKEQSWSPSLVPLIPGLTLPLDHAYPLVLALSLTQIIHEAGHAICGTFQSWIPLRMGLIVLFPCIPGAFVVLPQEAVEGEEEEDDTESYINEQSATGVTRKRLRNISAGVWHNALTALLLALVIYTGVGRAVHQVLWKDANGLRVESVDVSSPLLQHMPKGTLINRLDDLDLLDTDQLHRSPFKRQAAYELYLLQDGASHQEKKQGWCVPRSAWNSRPTSCCDALHRVSQKQGNTSEAASNSTAAQDLLCFEALNGASALPGRCYDPIRLVSSKSEGQRCSSKCSEGDICISPDKREQLIRIKITRSSQESSRVVLFQGSPLSVYSALTVSPYQFRLAWVSLPYHIFEWWNLFISYLLNLSVAMALLNMLPLPSLDGDVYLGFILAALVARYHKDTYANTDEYEDEEEFISGIQMGDTSRVTSRPDSPTQLRRPSAPPRLAAASAPQRQSFVNQNLQHTSNSRVQAKIQERFRWFTIGLAVFVFGGSILLHAIKQS